VGGVGYRYRIGLREGWRSRAILGIACGLVAGLALAAAADARRTWSALPRALRAGAAADAFVAADATRLGLDGATAYADAVDRLPGVVASARTAGVDLAQVQPDGTLNRQLRNGTALALMLDQAAFTTISRFRLLAGRLPALDRPDEILVNPELAAVTGWRIGDRVTDLRLFRIGDFDEDSEPVVAQGTPLALTIVGEARRIDEYVVEPDGRIPRIYLTPAFQEAYPDPWFYLNEAVVLAGGDAAVPAFREAVNELAAAMTGAQASISRTGEGEAFAQSARRPQVIGLWLFAAVVLAGLVLVAGQTIGRQIGAQQRDLTGLRALGVGRRQRWLLGTLHGATVAVVSAVVAVVVAAATSAVTPLGTAHDVEPHPGLSLDPTVLGFGALTVAALLTAASLLPARRLARAAETAATPAAASMAGADRPSRIPAALARAGCRPPFVVGSRFAVQPGRGPTAAPVRGVMVSVALAAALLTATVGFHSSLDRLVHTPRLYGWDWDAAVGAGFGTIPADAADQLLEAPGVVAASGFNIGSLRVGGVRVPAVGVDLVQGTVFPTLESGRLPLSPDEVVLGSKTLDRAGAAVGDVIEVGTPDGIRSMTVVGTATFPAIGASQFSETSLGTGAATISSVLGPTGGYNYIALRFDPAIDTEEAVRQLRALVLAAGCNDQSCVVTDSRPEQLSAYADIGTVWALGAGALALLLAVTLVHGLVTSVQTRRRDLAVLAVLGFVRGQASRTVMWEAVTLAVGGLLVGIPLGLIGCRLTWFAFTEALGIEPNGSVPLAVLAVLVAGVLAGAATIGLLCALELRRTSIGRTLTLP
jgi:ABC-type lipoprotein release transport system permease subunit